MENKKIMNFLQGNTEGDFEYPNFSLSSATFNITYILLLGTTAATILGALYPGAHQSTLNKPLADILIIESIVNFIATYFYSFFTKDSAKNKVVTESSVTAFRYMDWALTTPFLISAVALYAGYANRLEDGTYEFNTRALVPIVVYNWLMLLFGYLGEMGKISRQNGLIAGFIFFGLLLWTFWDSFVISNASKGLFAFLVIVWGAYGVFYTLPSQYKTVGYNILDMISKVGFSVFTLGTIINNNLEEAVAP
jgi:bacteriorhodopsin